MATKKRRRRVPVYYTETGSPDQFKEDTELPEDRFTYSSHGNRKYPEKVDEVFANAFVNFLNKTPFEADEITIYRYGIHIRPREGKWNTTTENAVRQILGEYKGSSMHVVDEADTFSIRINLGSKTREVLAGDAEEDLKKQKSLLTDIYATIADEYGQLEWFTFFETDEELAYD